MQSFNHRHTDWFSDDFKSGLMLSFALHIFLFILAFIVARILVPSSPKNATLELLKSSVRVDVVGMPKMTVQELKALQADIPKPAVAEVKPVQETKTETTEAAPKPDDIVIQEKGAAKKSLSEMLFNYSKKAPIAKKQVKGDKTGKTNDLSSLVLEGNRISKGTALVGDVSDTEDAPFVAYAEAVLEKTRDNWRLPTFLKDKNYQCRVHIWIAADGQLIRTEIRESSGNSDYDSKAVGAIRASAPFPAPPTDIVAKVSSNGFVLGFPL